MATSTTPQNVPALEPPPQQSGAIRSPLLAAELTRIETTEKAERDRQAAEELARQRELARFD